MTATTTTAGIWEQGDCACAPCATCGRWIRDERAWHFWVGLVRKLTVCAPCATATTEEV